MQDSSPAPEPVKNTLQEEQYVPTLVIQLNKDGSVTVDGPLSDRGLCYKMMELARDAIFEHALMKRLTPVKNGSGIIHRIFK